MQNSWKMKKKKKRKEYTTDFLPKDQKREIESQARGQVRGARARAAGGCCCWRIIGSAPKERLLHSQLRSTHMHTSRMLVEERWAELKNKKVKNHHEFAADVNFSNMPFYEYINTCNFCGFEIESFL